MNAMSKLTDRRFDNMSFEATVKAARALRAKGLKHREVDEKLFGVKLDPYCYDLVGSKSRELLNSKAAKSVK